MLSLKLNALLLVACTVTGCTKTLDFRNGEISNGKIYSAGENEAFSGRVTNVPFANLPAREITELTKIVGTVTKDPVWSELMLAYALGSAFGSNAAAILCDIEAKEGIVNGVATCKSASKNVQLFSIPFENGVVSGTAFVYDLRKSGTKVAEAAYVNGLLEGKSTVYSSSNGQVLHTANWSGGKTNGLEEMFDADTGRRIFSGTRIDGRLDGEISRFSSDGDLIEKQSWSNGVQQQLASASDVDGGRMDSCIDLWISAFRTEVGEDAVVSSEQMQEWEEWCKQGKKPTQ